MLENLPPVYFHKRRPFLTMTAEILARLLAKLHCQQAERERTICYRKRQIDVSFSWICPVIDNEFRHTIVKVVCRSTAA